MELFAARYIDQVIPGYKISKVFYNNSNANTLTLNLNDQGAKCILIKTIQWRSTSAVGTVNIFTLNNNITLLNQVYNLGAIPLIQYINYPLMDSNFTIDASDHNSVFVVSYQYFQVPKQRIKQNPANE
jgi:hypothetical protein